jgi:arylsulfatase A-like enzyme/tetratricopeptide (TPR) repeat protein
MKRAVGFFTLLLFFANILSHSEEKTPRLDVLLITIDTLRADYLSCYNQTNIKTPQIDRLAAQGLLFSRAYAHNVLTLPSHINILTGTYPFFHGVRDNIGFRLSEESILISEILKEKGYRTAAFIGAFPLDERFGLNQGFDLYDDFYGNTSYLHDLFYVERPADKVIDAAMDWIGKKQPNNTWFCWIHLFDPHSPYNPPQAFKEKYPSDFYGGEVAFVDQELGRLFDFLAKRKDKSFPLTILTSDHGESLGEHGEQTHGVFAYNSTLQVPLVIYQPKIFPRAQTFKEIVGHIDIAPTILDILGLKIPKDMQGRSLLRLSKKPSTWKEQDYYFESLSPNLLRNWAPLHGLIRGSSKFISLPLPELYDLDKDPSEKNNLIADKSRQADELKRGLSQILGREGQPLSSRRLETRETIEKLQSLGYLAHSFSTSQKINFTAKDDPKELIRLDQKMQEGVIAYQLQDIPRAIKIFEAILAERPDFTIIYSNLAFIMRETGRLDQAVEYVRRALELAPGDPFLMSHLAMYYQESGQLNQARTLLEGLAQSDPHDVETLNLLGVTYWKLGSNQEAIAVFQKAVALDKGDAGLYNNLGSVYLSQQDYSQANEYFEKALSYDSNLASAHNGIGVIKARNNQLAEAVLEWKRAVSLDKKQYDALYNLCLLLTQMNQFDEAVKYIELFIDTAPASQYSADIEKMKKLQYELKKK